MDTPFSTRILRWSADNGRNNLPWQEGRDPYRIWISEVMLQQTRVETVIPYFLDFISTFPDVLALSAATQDRVLALWSGLGYYTRARNLHRAAALICEHHGGEIPRSRGELEALPGIGRSTAAAILALAFDLPEPILDGNVKRLLSRFHGVEGWPGSGATGRRLWQLAEQNMPDLDCGAYTQAIMDLGALLCRQKGPDCPACPVASGCVARESGRVDELPYPRPGKKLPQRMVCMAMVQNRQGEVLLERRPEEGVWGGLWSFPELESPQQWDEWSEVYLGRRVKRPQCWHGVSHTFTHFRLEITPLHLELDGEVELTPEGGEWVTLAQLQERGVAAPVGRLIQRMSSKGKENGESGSVCEAGA